MLILIITRHDAIESIGVVRPRPKDGNLARLVIPRVIPPVCGNKTLIIRLPCRPRVISVRAACTKVAPTEAYHCIKHPIFRRHTKASAHRHTVKVIFFITIYAVGVRGFNKSARPALHTARNIENFKGVGACEVESAQPRTHCDASVPPRRHRCQCLKRASRVPRIRPKEVEPRQNARRF